MMKEAFQSVDIRQQKAQLQTILKAANVYKDGRIELEFRDRDSWYSRKWFSRRRASYVSWRVGFSESILNHKKQIIVR